VITRLNKQEISDPEEADPRLWEAVWFEEAADPADGNA